jgi:hypothetical protein
MVSAVLRATTAARDSAVACCISRSCRSESVAVADDDADYDGCGLGCSEGSGEVGGDIADCGGWHGLMR